MPTDPQDLSQGRWRWNGKEWIPSDLPLVPTEQSPVEPAAVRETVADSAQVIFGGSSFRPLIALIVAAVVLVVGLTGFAIAFRIANTPKPPPALSAKQVMAAAESQVQTTFSYHMTGSSSDDGSQIEITQQDPSAVEMSYSQGGLSLAAITIDNRTYIQANRSYLDRFNPALDPLADRWMIIPLDASFSSLQAVDTFRRGLACALGVRAPWRLAADSSLDSQPVHHVYLASGGNRVDVYIAAAGPAYLLRMSAAISVPDENLAYRPESTTPACPATNAGTLKPGASIHWVENFDSWGGDVHVGVPPEPVTLVNKSSNQ